MTTTTSLAFWLPNAITGVCTLVAALGGAGLTLRITGQRQRAERVEQQAQERQREQRLAIIEVLDAGHAWARSQEGIFMVLGTVTDAVELSKMETVNNHIPIAARYSKALVAGRLVVADLELAPLVRALSSALDRIPELAGAVMESARRRGRADVEPLGKASGFVKTNERLLEALEEKTLKRFSL